MTDLKINTYYDKREYDKQYYQQNKEKIRAKANELITCFCGGVYKHARRSIHIQSDIHCDYFRKQRSMNM